MFYILCILNINLEGNNNIYIRKITKIDENSIFRIRQILPICLRINNQTPVIQPTGEQPNNNFSKRRIIPKAPYGAHSILQQICI